MQPTILDHLPQKLLERPAAALARYLDGPTLIHLPGRRPGPVFVSVLQHGNEVSGWDAVRRLLTGRYQRDPLPRSLALFIGNIEAAAQNRRHLPDQHDMNRCWPGARNGSDGWHAILDHVTRHARALKPFASIDIHNNTGENPHYAAVNRIEPGALNLASRFSRTVVYFTEPAGVQSAAFGEFCPAVTLECGPPGKRGGTDHAMAYLESVLGMDALSARMPHPEDLDLFQVTAVVRIPEHVEFGFGGDGEGKSLMFERGLDRLNFTELPPGTRLARTSAGRSPLIAHDTDGVDRTDDWFQVDDGAVVTRRAAMPAMLTTQSDAIRQDCLCYLMERIRLKHPHATADAHGELPESRP
jgi:hypothetical protein